MAAADTARLIASLELNDSKFRAGAARAIGSIDRIDRRLGAFSGAVNRNLGRLVDTAVTRGTQLLVDGIKGGIDSLAELESATTSVDASLKAVGKTGQVTSAQIATWANEVEANVQAAFDDKDIVRGAGALIRYGKIATGNLKPALQVLADMAARTGSIDSASRALAKALADPAKAAGVLKKAGVTLTDAQQKQLKGLTSLNKKEQEHYLALRKTNKGAAERYKQTLLSNKAIKAQTFLIETVGKTTEGAAAGMNGEFVDMQKTLADTVEDAEKVLAKAAMPVLQKLGTRLTEALNNPETMAAIEGIGKGAATFLDEAIDFAAKIPWGSIKDALMVGGQGAKTILDAFKGMPDWVKTAVITGWGLNKVTGGLVEELGKGLIKGVLGMTAGVVNIKAGVVNGGPAVHGAGAGAGGAAAGAAGLAPMGLGAVFATALAGFGFGELGTAISHAVTDGLSDVFGLGQPGKDAGQRARDQTFLGLFDKINDIPGTLGRMGDALGDLNTFLNSPHPDFLGDLGKLLTLTSPSTPTDPATVESALQDFRKGERDAWTDTTGAVRDVKREQAMAAASLGHAIGSNESTTRGGLSNAVAATNTQGALTRGAIAANRPVVTTNVDVDVNVTSAGVEKATTTSTRYGQQNGSAGGGGGHGGGGSFAG